MVRCNVNTIAYTAAYLTFFPWCYYSLCVDGDDIVPESPTAATAAGDPEMSQVQDDDNDDDDDSPKELKDEGGMK